MSWKDNVATRAVKKYALATTVFVASVFGGGAKAVAAERDDAPEDKIEVVEAPQQQNQERRQKRTYTFTRATPPNNNQSTQSRQATRSSQQVASARQTNRTPQSTHNTQTRQPQTQQKKKKSAVAQSIENRINNTKQAINSVAAQERRNWETAGARRVHEMYNDYLRHKNKAYADARAKQQADKRYAENFEIIVGNALAFKYQVDNGNSLREYIPYNVRENIINKAKAHGKNVYKLLRRDANQDAIMDYMGSALEGVACTPKSNRYEYRGEEATISGNLVRSMEVKNNNYTIGGNRYSR